MLAQLCFYNATNWEDLGGGAACSASSVHRRPHSSTLAPSDGPPLVQVALGRPPDKTTRSDCINEPSLILGNFSARCQQQVLMRTAYIVINDSTKMLQCWVVTIPSAVSLPTTSPGEPPGASRHKLRPLSGRNPASAPRAPHVARPPLARTQGDARVALRGFGASPQPSSSRNFEGRLTPAPTQDNLSR